MLYNFIYVIIVMTFFNTESLNINGCCSTVKRNDHFSYLILIKADVILKHTQICRTSHSGLDTGSGLTNGRAQMLVQGLPFCFQSF